MYDSSHDFKVAILVNGRPIPEVHFNGRTYIEGRKNSEYSLQIRNNTNHRILAVPSVDGINVLNGAECGLESPGFVIDPFITVDIPGWKVEGLPEAGRFQFNPQGAKYGDEETYAERLGLNPTNQGAIGFMIFREKEVLRWTPPPFDPCRPPIKTFDGGPTVKSVFNDGGATLDSPRGFSSGSSGTCSSVPVSSNVCDDAHLGTGWGEAVEFHTHDVEFERADPANPDVVFVYHYDTIRNLKRIGVPVEQFYGHASTPTEANPFPASPHVHGGGCKPPPGWRRKKSRRGRS